MNKLCECKAAGFCHRHMVEKSEREYQLCRGINCSGAKSAKYWNAWEKGLLAGQAGIPPVEQPIDFAEGHGRMSPNHVSKGLGDWLGNKIHEWTGIKPCGGCKQRAAWLNHFFPATLPPIEPIQLTAPVRHLTMHIWPVKRNGGWQWNCDRLLEHAALFNGRRIVSIVTDEATDCVDDVRHYLRDFTDEILTFRNNSKLREVVSWVPMLERLEQYQSDQDVTFSCHAKGVRHNVETNSQSSSLFRWAAAMYETLLPNDFEEVRKLLETSATVGSFRRYWAAQKNGWGIWHYSGAFYWWRNRDVYRRNWRYVPQFFYGTESWIGNIFSPDESANVIGDNVGDLYSLEYFKRVTEGQLAAWRKAREQQAEKEVAACPST